MSDTKKFKVYDKDGKVLNMADVIFKNLEDNLKVKVERDYDYHLDGGVSFDVILMLGDKEISRSDFEVYS